MSILQFENFKWNNVKLFLTKNSNPTGLDYIGSQGSDHWEG